MNTYNLPLEASKINELMNTLNNIENEMYFQPGDVLECTRLISMGGFLTSSGTDLAFQIYLPKRTDKVTSCIIEEAYGNIRAYQGYFGSFIAEGTNYVEASDSVAAYFTPDHSSVLIHFYKSSWLSTSGAVNNTSLQMQALKLKLRFE